MCARQSVAAISMPGVQMPHCAAPWARNASRRRSVTPSGPGPSTVWIEAPSAWAVATRQAQTCSPSISTVQAPQSPASQPIFVPVRPRPSRRVEARLAKGAAATRDCLAIDAEAKPTGALARRVAAGRASGGPPLGVAGEAGEEVAHQIERGSAAEGAGAADVVDR